MRVRVCVGGGANLFCMKYMETQVLGNSLPLITPLRVSMKSINVTCEVRVNTRSEVKGQSSP